MCLHTGLYLPCPSMGICPANYSCNILQTHVYPLQSSLQSSRQEELSQKINVPDGHVHMYMYGGGCNFI